MNRSEVNAGGRVLGPATILAVVFAMGASLAAQTPVPSPSAPPSAAGVAMTPTEDPNAVPTDYVIGVDDILTISFWRDEAMSSDVVVRPDGKITLPLLNEIDAIGLRPEELRLRITEAASKIIEGPTVNVIVKQINSRKVFVMGEVRQTGPYALSGRMDVLQVLTLAGGLTEYANKGDISILRTENGERKRFKFNYNDVVQGKNLEQNIELKPGDTIVVRD
jgi:polysaccharide export outer membrane protein